MVSKNSEAQKCANTLGLSSSKSRKGNIDMNSLSKAAPNFTNFKFGKSEIRVVTQAGEPWFVADDVCKALKLSNPTMSLKSLDDDERSKLNLGRQGEANIISESGMFTLVLRCRDAVKFGSVPHQFRKWVTAEVLPSIRKTGSYQQQVPAIRQPPKYRYTISMTVHDSVTGQTETFKGGANTPDEIINGTARNFGMHIFDMVAVPFVAY